MCYYFHVGEDGLANDAVCREADNAKSSDAVWSQLTATLQTGHFVVPTLCQYQTRSMVSGCLLYRRFRQRTCSLEGKLLSLSRGLVFGQIMVDVFAYTMDIRVRRSGGWLRVGG